MFPARTQITAPAEITSSKNPLLKEIRKAISRGGITDDGFCVAESFHLLEEAIRSECVIQAVIAAESIRATVERRVKGLKGVTVTRVPDSVFAQLSTTETSQGVITLVKPPSWELEHVLRGHALVALLDGIQDPGNAGAIVRAAEAFGGTGVIFLRGSVNPYNPKALRASAGSLFRLPLVAGVDDAIVRAALEQKRIDLYAAIPDAKASLSESDLTRRCAIVIGSEGRGVSPKLRDKAIGVRIPTTQVDSLNAAVAAGILLYEARRQRQLSP